MSYLSVSIGVIVFGSTFYCVCYKAIVIAQNKMCFM